MQTEKIRGAKVVGTIDLTPTWRGLIPLFIAAIENGTPDGRRLAIEELYRLADFADGVRGTAKEPPFFWATREAAEDIRRWYMEGHDECGSSYVGKEDRGWFVEVSNSEKAYRLTREDF